MDKPIIVANGKQKLEVCLPYGGLFSKRYLDILFWFAYPSVKYLDGSIIGTFCRRQKYPKTPLQIYEAIFVTQNRPKNSSITHKAYYSSLFLELLLNRFAFKDSLQKHRAIGCKRTKSDGISVAQRWRGAFISGAYAVSNCLMFLKRSFGTPFCSFQKVSKDAMKQCYSFGYGGQNSIALLSENRLATLYLIKPEKVILLPL